jgi:enterochelin esterase-like enzyme
MGSCIFLLSPAMSWSAGASETESGFQHVVTQRDSGRVDGVLYVHSGFEGSSGAERRVFVLLPPSYAASTRREYPVLYALGGRILFDSSQSAGDEWTLDEILARRPAGVPELLVVSIDPGRESVLEQAPPGSRDAARGDDLLRFLTEQVQPFVAGSYRVRREREAAFLLGMGDGALFVLYAAWERPDRFAGAMALECPDVDGPSMEWIRGRVPEERPWIWFEQAASDKARPSNADFLAALRRSGDVQHLVTTSGSNRTARLLAALRACPWR